MIDLRSDLCSLPTEEMWEAMRAAELGWATYGEDASVNELCARVAALLGKPAALWVPTCGMANLVALLTFCGAGDRVVLESASHVLTSEAMGIETIAGLEPRSLWAADGRLDPDEVDELVAESHAALLVLENTHTRAGGTALSVELTKALAEAAGRHGCRVHLDGARLVNASVALDVPLAELAAPANSVALSLNKGLSAPMGTVLAGSDAVVERARTMLRRLGGASVHRAGIAAAAGLVALETTIHGIADDHRRARALAARLAAVPGLRLQPATVETNIVLVDVSCTGLSPEEVVRGLAADGVLVMERDTHRIRLVTHRLIGDAEVDRAAEALARLAASAEDHGTAARAS
ncbi:MAG: beta-eliminating lyase-related protein [Thermoleophilia bacterium]|nr:beta-eliminating lyase-related protein [Thermoleophilia bacterium]